MSTLTGHADLLRRHAEEVAVLKATIERQAKVIEAAREVAVTSRLNGSLLPGGWTQFNARLLVEAKEIDKALAELDTSK